MTACETSERKKKVCVCVCVCVCVRERESWFYETGSFECVKKRGREKKTRKRMKM